MTARLLAELRAAALAGRRCPASAALCGLAGYQSIGAVVAAIQRLERAGEFKVERFNNARVITFPDGKATARPANEVPHWRDRRRAQVSA